MAILLTDQTLARIMRAVTIVESDAGRRRAERAPGPIQVRRKIDVSVGRGGPRSVHLGWITDVDLSGFNAVYDAVSAELDSITVEDAEPLDRPIANPAIYTPREIDDPCLLLVDPEDNQVVGLLAFEVMDPAPCVEEE